MKPVERILLVTDLAAHADRAMERAVQLARQSSADLAVLAVPGDGIGHASRADRVALVRRHLGTLPQAAELDPLIAVAGGPLDEAAAAFDRNWAADLMVTGAHLSGSEPDIFAVGMVERISVARPTPLLVVRNKPFGPYASALVPVDFLDTSRQSVAAALALIPEGSIQLLHVFDALGAVPPPAHQGGGGFAGDFAALLEGLETTGRAMGICVRYGDARTEILAVAHAEAPDLMVMGTQGRRGVNRFLIGSTAHEVLEHLPADVLLVRAP